MQRKCACGSESLILYGDGDGVVITTQEMPVRFLMVSGKPIGEPIAWYGPIVMNSREELRIAFEEYENGTFIKHK
jgi:quercetin 2,3-dioxygenase